MLIRLVDISISGCNNETFVVLFSGRYNESSLLFSTRATSHLHSLRERHNFERHASSTRFLWRNINIWGRISFSIDAVFHLPRVFVQWHYGLSVAAKLIRIQTTSISPLQGRFEILSLSGSFMPNDRAGTKSRSGGMSVSLSSPDGRIVGGGVAGLLVAATPIQVCDLFLYILVSYLVK